MRTLVFLLVLVNLVFFSWAQGYFGAPVNPDALRMEQQLSPERLVVIGRGEMPAVKEEVLEESGAAVKSGVPSEVQSASQPTTPAVAEAETSSEKVAEKPAEKVPEKKEANVCLQWNDLAVSDGDKIERLVVGKYSSLKLKRHNTTASGNYWVFIPAAVSRQEAESKALELKELGAPEYFIVTDSGPNRLAISLGVFSTLEAANERLEAVRAKGVRTARVGERNFKPALAFLEVRGPQSVSDALRDAVGTVLPKAKATSCKVAQK